MTIYSIRSLLEYRELITYLYKRDLQLLLDTYNP
jgi:hypothetical protein